MIGQAGERAAAGAAEERGGRVAVVVGDEV
eukprot:SAG11_NODE_11025_length_789_cov_0.856522_1_plen_29_part_10